MKIYIFLLILMTTTINHSQQVNSLIVRAIPTKSHPTIQLRVKLKNNFYRGYARIVLSEDQSFSSDDVPIGGGRVYGNSFDDNGFVDYSKYLGAKEEFSNKKDKYYIIVRTKLYLDDDNSWHTSYYTSSTNYCINLLDNSKNCNPKVAEKPNFIISSVSIKVDEDDGTKTKTTNPSETLKLRINKWNDIYIKIKNEGGTTAAPHNIQVIISSHTDLLNSNAIVENFISSNIDEIIGANKTKEFLLGSPYISDKYLGHNISVFKYLLFFVDYNDDVDEEGEDVGDDNYLVAPLIFRVSKPSPYPKLITVYDIYGNSIKKANVINENIENELIKSLSNGLFILNSENGTSKKILKQ